MTCLLIGGGLWFTTRYHKSAAAAPATVPQPAPKPAEVLWLREGSARVRIVPSEIVWASLAGNYIE